MPLEALRQCDPAPDEVIVVDNGSTDKLSLFVRKHYPEVRLIRSKRNLGFAGGNNLGIRKASGDILILLNDDTEPHSDWLAPLVKVFEEEQELGIAGCQLLYPDGTTIQHLGGIVHPNGLTDHLSWGEQMAESEKLCYTDYATGAAMAIRREVVEEIGLLDAAFWPIYFEEVDYCRSARLAGWKVAVLAQSKVIHHESQTTGRLSARFLRLYHKNRVRYLLKSPGFRDFFRAIKAEVRWIYDHRPWDQLWPCALAWSWSPFQMASILYGRFSGPGRISKARKVKA